MGKETYDVTLQSETSIRFQVEPMEMVLDAACLYIPQRNMQNVYPSGSER
jgi:hypothetical protein